jgi:hypothetical protein
MPIPRAPTKTTLSGAWRYRDYVIDAFNRDLPYNRFVVEQLAGDMLRQKAMMLGLE